MYQDAGGTPPTNDKAPELTTSEARCNTTHDAATQPVYHTTTPSTYPCTRLSRTGGGWMLTRWDGWGQVYRWYCRYRSDALDIIDQISRGRILADITVRGVS